MIIQDDIPNNINIRIDELSDPVIEIAKQAGAAILEIYQSVETYTTEKKADDSPVTDADIAADKIISKKLRELTPQIPILSEESLIDFETRKTWQAYWLVDPLDGTREFIKRNGEFTVNIALINQGRPVFGVIHAPVKEVTYFGFNHKAWKEMSGQRIQIKPKSANPIKISVSRSHRCQQIDELLAKLNNFEVKTVGSSLKFCWLAEGEIQYYPRANSISLWDIAAGEAILTAAGANMTDWEGNQIDYTPSPSFSAPPFKAWFGDFN
ncbi:3'(2'),5'-bisphosphate nucleotidase CysQ [Thorsellia anophelis]|uniref:3'(2'),5'-bisphosphate nucleotidase CysQ n=1 Tax=Thorsellia anophelis DSM 18579 TaxID=1123402 RepID=A0A1I0ACC7_9GAMM|nr:3'(2'),5'-bisphosphate nucleotidase CysQ [Thorsellia anophelis]SES91335.1 3'(2'),5'-bisphosphate nucleotidase [Thorsellia anophelis DSM 18579]